MVRRTIVSQQCLDNLPRFAMTCPSVTPQPGVPITLGVCMPSLIADGRPYSRCMLEELIGHELVHVRQILDTVCGGKPYGAPPDREEEGYDAQCSLRASHCCIPSDDRDAFVAACITRHKPGSTDPGNQDLLRKACIEFLNLNR